MSNPEILATATIEKRETGLGTSPRVVKLIPRRAVSISSLHGAKTNLKAKKNMLATSKKKSRVTNGLTAVFSIFFAAFVFKENWKNWKYDHK